MAKAGLFISSITFGEFRIFQNERFEFKNHRNTVSGASASGKTTILLALKKLTLESISLDYEPISDIEKNPNVSIGLIYGDCEYSLLGFGTPELNSYCLRLNNFDDEYTLTEEEARSVLHNISENVIDLDQLYIESKNEAAESAFHVSVYDVWIKILAGKLDSSLPVILGEAEWDNILDDQARDSEDWRDFEGYFELGVQSILASHTPSFGETPYHSIIHLWSQDDRKQQELLKQIAIKIQLQSVSSDLFAESTYWNIGKKISLNSELDINNPFSDSEYQLVNIEGRDINGIITNLSNQGGHFILILESVNGGSSSTFLGIISKIRSEKILVAKNEEDFDLDSFCLAFNEKTDCNVKSFGVWVNAENFFGIEPILATNEIKEMIDENYMQKLEYDSLVLERKFYKTGDKIEDLQKLPNSIFLFTRFNYQGSFCFTMDEVINELSERGLSGIVQLQLDPKKANSEYAKLVLNGLLSSKYERLLSYNGIINHKNLVNLFHLYLPETDQQQMILDYYNQIRGEIAEKTLRLQEIGMPNFSPLNIDSYTSLDWIKDIPYPLASILQTYRTISDHEPDKQLNQILYFFEAFSQFLAVIHLSAWQSSPDWDEIWMKFTNKQDSQGKPISKSLSMPDFGFWNRINNKFRKENNKPVRDLGIYSGLGSEFLSMVKSREITEILDECANIRNITKGHGVITTQIAIENVYKLLKHLNRLRGLIHKPFATVQMIRPGLGRMKSKYHCEVELLTGVSTPFRKKPLQFTSPPSSDYDFLTSPGSETFLQLVPLLKRGPHMETYEFSYYFYSRKTTDEVMFNNYHSTIEGSRKYHVSEEIKLLTFLNNLSN
jgi:hypothetical protein